MRMEDENHRLLERSNEYEERVLTNLLDSSNPERLRSSGHAWLYRPSHHIASGLIRESDIAKLSEKNARMLSVGAGPGVFEQMLVAFGVPSDHIVFADIEPRNEDSKPAEYYCFDMTEKWPEMGTFDLIIFPESLCIAIREKYEAKRDDSAHAASLTHILKEALSRLRRSGEIRANGPQCHPKIVKEAKENLDKVGIPHCIDYARFFLRVTHDIDRRTLT